MAPNSPQKYRYEFQKIKYKEERFPGNSVFNQLLEGKKLKK